MSFGNKRYITSGVEEKVNPLLQLLLWQCIDTLEEPKDYLQVFDCDLQDGKQKIKHTQEEPAYEREYLLLTDAPVFVGKIFVIDDGPVCTMLLAEEY